MQKQQSYSKSCSLRFKRWSRKSYAAFVSLHHEVTIGNLSAHVSDRICQKQDNTSVFFLFSDAAIDDASYEKAVLDDINPDEDTLALQLAGYSVFSSIVSNDSDYSLIYTTSLYKGGNTLAIS